MRDFWNFSHIKNNNDLAVITEKSIKISYETFDKDILSFQKRLPVGKKLIFLKLENTYTSLIAYFACLRERHPFLVINAAIEKFELDKLLTIYKPNLIIQNLEIMPFSFVEHIIHDQLALLLSTSGTTGSPSLVRLSANNIRSNAASIVKYLKIENYDKTITTLPMSYAYGLSIINSHFHAGACVVLNALTFFDQGFWDAINNHQVTSFSGVPYTFEILKKLNYVNFNTNSIRYLTQAGGHLDDSVKEYFIDVCQKKGQSFFVMYGQTEASPRMSFVPSEKLAQKISSIGIAIPGGTLTIRNGSSDIINQPYIHGEIFYEGPNVMLGLASSLTDLANGDEQNGVLATGDIGYFDSDDFFYIIGRSKRFIKVHGHRINMDEIEHWLLAQRITGVVIAVDEKLTLCLEKHTGDCSLLKKQLSAYFNLHISGILIHALSFELPRMPSGKVNYQLLLDFVKSSKN